MFGRRLTLRLGTLILAAMVDGQGNSRVFGQTQQPPPVPAGATAEAQEPEALTSGPLHEAFAAPTSVEAEAAEPATQSAPPAAVNEAPPDSKPPGAVWIPGYWSWDPSISDYIWVSGVWRVPPAQRSWVPGYWSQTADGRWLWTPGFWMATAVKTVEYLPPPPPPVEVEPVVVAPSPDAIWVPGTWVYVRGHYKWRPGYFVDAYPDWVWQPARYVCTPHGYVFVEGYWDYVVEARGVVFAPVYFRPRGGVYVSAGFTFSPSIVIETSFITTDLFIGFGIGHGHFFFGNYYGGPCRAWSRPWCDPWPRYRHCYEPIYCHRKWDRCRKDRDWDRHERDRYDRRERGEDRRPPRTYKEAQKDYAGFDGRGEGGDRRIATSLKEYGERKDVKLERVDSRERKSIEHTAKKVDEYRDRRRLWESRDTAMKSDAVEKGSGGLRTGGGTRDKSPGDLRRGTGTRTDSNGSGGDLRRGSGTTTTDRTTGNDLRRGTGKTTTDSTRGSGTDLRRRESSGSDRTGGYDLRRGTGTTTTTDRTTGGDLRRGSGTTRSDNSGSYDLRRGGSTWNTGGSRGTGGYDNSRVKVPTPPIGGERVRATPAPPSFPRPEQRVFRDSGSSGSSSRGLGGSGGSRSGGSNSGGSSSGGSRGGEGGGGLRK